MKSLTAIRKIYSHFGHHVHPYRGSLLVAWLCMGGALGTELLRPWPIKYIFDGLLSSHPKVTIPALFTFGGNAEMLLAVIALSILLIAVLDGFFDYCQAYVISTVGQKVIAAIRHQLYSHIQRLSHSFHSSHHSGDLLMRLTGDIELIRELIVDSFLYLSNRILILVGMIVVMLWKDWELTLLALAVLPILVVTAFNYTGRIREATKRQRRKQSQIASVINETISATSVVKAFTRETYEDERFSSRNAASLQAELKTTRLEKNLNRVVEITLALGTCGVLWFGVKRVMGGVLTPGDLVIFISYLNGMYKPIRKMASLTTRITKATACGERITTILDTEPEIKDAPDAMTAPPFRGKIVFKDVDFSYELGQPVLRGINLTIEPGQAVALVGPSGAGKSTIANLILRFYDPQSGRVLIDGTDIQRYKLSSLREQIGLVFQKAILFSASVRDNIAYGKPNATEEEIVAAAKAANAHGFIMKFENGYDTLIGERGDTLSGGQRQRIAIARAIIRNAPLLILDEPMTCLDIESEAKVREALKRLMVGKTCLLITHDLEAVAESDLVLMLEEGSIVEQGRHQELMERSTRYRQLYQLKMDNRLDREEFGKVSVTEA